MTGLNLLVIEPLNNAQERAAFRCDMEALGHYLGMQVRQDIKCRISHVFFATRSENPGRVLGYHTLSTLSIAVSQLPEHPSRKLPKHPIPAALIGRLAVSKAERGYRIGKLLLSDAIKRTLDVSNQMAIHALVVDAIDEKARGFYEQYGFIHCSDSTRLYLPLKAI